MKKGFEIKIKTINNTPHVELEPTNLNVDEFITLAGTALDYALSAAFTQLKDKPELQDDEDTQKELRAALYDRLIFITTEIANKIYPEHVNLYEKTPEAFLEHLDNKSKEIDDKIKELKELENNR